MLAIGGRYDGEKEALEIFHGLHLKWTQERVLESHSRLECGGGIFFVHALRGVRSIVLR